MSPGNVVCVRVMSYGISLQKEVEELGSSAEVSSLISFIIAIFEIE
jgi:hypothetical protein